MHAHVRLCMRMQAGVVRPSLACRCTCVRVICARRWQTKEAADAAAPVQSALPPRPSAGAAAVNSELAAALAARRGVAAAAAGDEEDGQ